MILQKKKKKNKKNVWVWIKYQFKPDKVRERQIQRSEHQRYVF